MVVLVLSFFTAFTLVYFAIPSIIYIARVKHLFDEPGERSSHKVSTPSLGGIAIFAGALFSIILWTPFEEFGNLQYILCALIIVFLIGAKDDIAPMPASKKLIGQLLAACILVFKSDIRLDSLYGLFWVDFTLPFWISVIISIFTILVIMNAFNLIDGINGLAGGVGAVIAVTFGCWFFVAGRIEYATVAFATVGAVLAFMRYNVTPAQIFMGDTGSLILGTVTAVLAIKFIDCSYTMQDELNIGFVNSPAIAAGILIIPLFDTVRVFTTRIVRGRSPFDADRRHIHHLLIDYGFSHMQATAILLLVNMIFISFALSLGKVLELHVLLLLEIAVAGSLTYYLHRNVNQRRVRQQLIQSKA